MTTAVLEMSNVIFTEEENARIVQYGDDKGNAMWGLGDLVSKKIRLLKRVKAENRNVNVMGIMEAYDHVSDLCGEPANTIRQYREIAEFYPPDVRGIFEPLTFSHFREAKRAGDLVTAQKWLKRCLKTADIYDGRPMPIRVLKARIDNADIEDEAADELPLSLRTERFISNFKKLWRAAKMVKNDDIPTAVRSKFELAVTCLRDIQDYFDNQDN